MMEKRRHEDRNSGEEARRDPQNLIGLQRTTPPLKPFIITKGELQKQVFESKQVIGMEEDLQMIKDKQKQMASKVLAKMNNVDDSRPVYRQIGRAYVISTKADEVKRMETIMSECDAEIKKSEERKKICYEMC